MENVQTKTFPFFSEKHKINNYAHHVNNSHTEINKEKFKCYTCENSSHFANVCKYIILFIFIIYFIIILILCN